MVESSTPEETAVAPPEGGVDDPRAEVTELVRSLRDEHPYGVWFAFAKARADKALTSLKGQKEGQRAEEPDMGYLVKKYQKRADELGIILDLYGEYKGYEVKQQLVRIHELQLNEDTRMDYIDEYDLVQSATGLDPSSVVSTG